MEYQSLYRRYRSRRFSEQRGQEHIVKALRTAVETNRVGHAYLFSGPRGTGKTSTARILAKVLNCTNVVGGEPCCECDSCKSVEAGTSYDVHELDAASNNGVDSMRDLIEKTMLGTPGRHKVYILDEVHMLSKAAEAALLKTLEEPPPHVVFVLATTDPQKVSDTIRSRCQSLNFQLLPASQLADHLRFISSDAGLDLSDEVIEAAVVRGAGSARDTLSALETLIAGGGIDDDGEPIDNLIQALIDSDSAAGIAAIAKASAAGRDARNTTERLVVRLRDCLLGSLAPDLVQLPERARQQVTEQSRQLGLASITRAMEVLGEALVEMRQAPDPRLLLDVAMVRLTRPEADTSLSALLARIERLEKGQGAEPMSRATVAATPTNVAQPAGQGSAAAVRAAMAANRAGDDTPSAPVANRAQLGQRAQRPGPAAAVAPLVAAPAAPPVAIAPSADVTRPVDLPRRDALTLAWSDSILPSMKGLAKALYAIGRFTDNEGNSTRFSVPPNTPLTRLEEHRPTVEAALAKHFGRPVPVRLIIEGNATDHAVSRLAEPEPDDENYDPSELTDAPAEGAVTPVDRLVQAFPGAELIDDKG